MELQYAVRGYDCGYGGPLKTFALANFFQEAAGAHALVLGIGMKEMWARGLTWMLSRIDIEIEDLPRSGDEVIVRTWPAGVERIFAMRYLELRSATGRLMAGALYNYLIVDMEKRRPLRPEKILSQTMKSELPAPYPDLAPGVPDVLGFTGSVPEGWTEAFRMQVGPRHIDYNNHVNNAYIIDWLCDAIPTEQRGSGRAARIKVDFMLELKAGEEITAYWADATALDGTSIKAFAASSIGSNDKLSVLRRGTEVVARALTRWA